MKNKNIFNYSVRLVECNIRNGERSAFRQNLINLPYLLYDVEHMSNGDRIVVNKPGGKRSFGRLSKDDFMVFIYQNNAGCLWLISHNEIAEDLQKKHLIDADNAIKIVKALYWVCMGEEPDEVLQRFRIYDIEGTINVETMLKAYKWIWGQEDCNYPQGEGRWLSMNDLMNLFNIDRNTIEHEEDN